MSALSFSAYWTCTNNGVVSKALARWMSRSVHPNDRKAAYRVPHRRATDICHLQSFISTPPPPTHTYTHSCTLLSRRRVPTSKASLPLISLITQTVCSSTPPSSAARGNEKSEKGEGEDRGDDSFIREGSYVLKGAALAAKTFL